MHRDTHAWPTLYAHIEAEPIHARFALVCETPTLPELQKDDYACSMQSEPAFPDPALLVAHGLGCFNPPLIYSTLKLCQPPLLGKVSNIGGRETSSYSSRFLQALLGQKCFMTPCLIHCVRCARLGDRSYRISSGRAQWNRKGFVSDIRRPGPDLLLSHVLAPVLGASLSSPSFFFFFSSLFLFFFILMKSKGDGIPTSWLCEDT